MKRRPPLSKWPAYLIAGMIVAICVASLRVLMREVQSWPLAIETFALAVKWFGLGWLAHAFWLLKTRKKIAREVSATPHDIEFLTPSDISHINIHRTCPDCAVGELLMGPRGGASINMKCANGECRHEFNLAEHLGQIVLGNRIDRDEPALYHTAEPWE